MKWPCVQSVKRGYCISDNFIRIRHLQSFLLQEAASQGNFTYIAPKEHFKSFI